MFTKIHFILVFSYINRICGVYSSMNRIVINWDKYFLYINSYLLRRYWDIQVIEWEILVCNYLTDVKLRIDYCLMLHSSFLLYKILIFVWFFLSHCHLWKSFNRYFHQMILLVCVYETEILFSFQCGYMK